MDDLPIIGVTAGDAAGIGPEVAAKALQHPDVRNICRPLLIGDARIFRDAKFAAVMPQFDVVKTVPHRDDLRGLTILDLRNLNPEDVVMGRGNAPTGRAAVDNVLKAAGLAMTGAIDAVATAPLNKEAIRWAGYDYIDHTGIFAAVTGAKKYTTLLATPGLRVTHVTRHIPFQDIASHINESDVLDTITVTNEGMTMLGLPNPRIAVAGLNPHNGEGGLMGREEIDIIMPAVKAASDKGIDVEGPIPADSVFHRAIRGRYDVVVALYHDQGHIAVKTYGFEKSFTVTLGLPIIRTSADHGTAFDIAGKGIASDESMRSAVMEAASIVQKRREQR